MDWIAGVDELGSETQLSEGWTYVLKAQFLGFAQRLITGGLQGAGVHDSNAIAIATHLFPGLITLQRLTATANLPSTDIEVDSDHVSEKLASSNLSIKGKSIPTAKLLGWAYEAHRNHQFPASPKLGARGILALADAKSRAIQVADVFGNFALSYIFVLHGHTSKSRKVKAEIFERVFSKEITPGPILSATKLSGPTLNDIEIIQPGGLTLRVGP